MRLVARRAQERFLTMVYPTLCLGAALTLDAALAAFADGVTATRLGTLAPRGRRAVAGSVRVGCALVVVGSVALCAARSAALVAYYGGPLEVFAKLPASASHVCVGKEWYRFPSTFFLAPGAAPLLWVRGGFTGQLPQPYAPWPNGLWTTPAHMNDLNKEEPTRYAGKEQCRYFVDLDLAGQAEPSVVQDVASWERVHCAPFLDASRSTSTLARAFFIPVLSARRNVYADYCLMVKRHPEPARRTYKAVQR